MINLGFHIEIRMLQNIDCSLEDGDQFKLKMLVVLVVLDFDQLGGFYIHKVKFCNSSTGKNYNNAAQKTADLVTFTEEILNEKLHFLYSVMIATAKMRVLELN